MPKFRTNVAFGEPTPKSYFEGMSWIRANRRQLVEQYGDCYIVVYNEKVLATGQTYQEAMSNAENDAPIELEGVAIAYDYRWIYTIQSSHK